MFGWRQKTENRINVIREEVEELDNNLIDSFSNVKGDTQQLFGWTNYFYSRIMVLENMMKTLEYHLHYKATKSDIQQAIDYFYAEQKKIKDLAEQGVSELKAFENSVKSEFTGVIDNQKNVFRELDKVTEKVNLFHASIEAKNYLDKDSFYEKIQPFDEKMDTFNEKIDVFNERINDFDEIISKLRNIRSRPVESEDYLLKIEQIEKRIHLLETRYKPKTVKEKIMTKISRRSKEYMKGMVLSLIKKYGRMSALQLREMVVEEQGLLSKSSFYRLLTEIEGSDEVSMLSEGKEKVYVYVYPKAGQQLNT